MDVRPVYWALCGAGATLLTSAWGSKQVMLLPQNQEVNVTPVAQATIGLPQSVANTSLLIKRQPWAEAKSNPFAMAVPVGQKVIAPVADKVVIPQPQPPSFPYVFIGRLQAEEKDAVFLTRNNQNYTVAAGDTLEGVYRIERVGGNELEITYLPDQQKLTISFDALILKPASNTGIAPPQAGAPAGGFFPPPTLQKGMAGEAHGKNNVQMAENLKLAMTFSLSPRGGVQSMAGATPSPVIAARATSEISGKNRDQITETFKQALALHPPQQGDVFNTGGAKSSPVLTVGMAGEAPDENKGQMADGFKQAMTDAMTAPAAP